MENHKIDNNFHADFSSKKKYQLFWSLQMFGWIGYAVIFIFFVTPRRPESFTEIFLGSITYITGFIVSLFLWHVNRKIRKKKGSLFILSIYILIYSFILSVLWLAFDWLISSPFWSPEVSKEKIHALNSNITAFSWVLSYFIKLLPWSLLYFFINFWFEWNKQKNMAEKNKALYAEAKLLMLRYQLNPHFFFNALNSIDVLIDEDKNIAKEMIYKLSDFLRYSFLSDNDPNTNLENELSVIEKYFAIEKIRFEEKLEITYDIDPNTLVFKIPVLILNPIVENAIKYGMKTSPLPLKVGITSKIIPKGLFLQISNTGKWDGEEFEFINSTRKGIGLKNVYDRLENEYGSDFEVSIYQETEKVNVNIFIKSPKSSEE